MSPLVATNPNLTPSHGLYNSVRRGGIVSKRIVSVSRFFRVGRTDISPRGLGRKVSGEPVTFSYFRAVRGSLPSVCLISRIVDQITILLSCLKNRILLVLVGRNRKK